MKGKKFLTVISISILAGVAQGGIKPTVCPKVSLIQQKGVTRTLEIDTNLYPRYFKMRDFMRLKFFVLKTFESE